MLFVKVENDGYGLGAQRRAVLGDDLPEAGRLLRAFFADASAFENCPLAHKVAREKIGENGDWNLSGERYIETSFEHAHFPVLAIGNVCQINPKKSELSGTPVDTVVSFVPMKDLAENNIDFQPQEQRALDEVLNGAYTYFRDGDVLIAKVTPCFENGKAGVARNLTNGIGFGSSEYYVLRPSEVILPELLYYFVSSPRFKEYATPAMTGTGGLQRVPRSTLELFKIPLPPLAIQQEIVTEIEGYQKIIDGARQVVENYRPRIYVRPDWPLVPLNELFSTKSGKTPSRDKPAYFSNGHIPWVKTLDLNDGPILSTDECVTDIALAETHLGILPKGTVLIAMYGGLNQIGRTGVLEIEAVHNQAMTALLPTPKVEPYYLNAVFVSFRDYWKTVANSTRKDPNITKSDVVNFRLPLPDLETQRAIVAEIEAEQALVNANRELITRFEAKIKATINRVWSCSE